MKKKSTFDTLSVQMAEYKTKITLFITIDPTENNLKVPRSFSGV